MRQLPTSPEPKALTAGRAKLQATPDISTDWYDVLDTDAKNAVRDQRLREQGHLCAYTELRLSHDDFHIEHMFPQDYCDPPEKVAYDNLVLCYPKGRNPGFGAVEKDNWPDKSQRSMFVRPVDPSCTTRFHYKNDGQMVAITNSDVAAKETISHLKLSEPVNPDNPQNYVLQKRRMEAIISVLGGLKTVDQVRSRLAEQSKVNAQGCLPEFISAKQQALERHLKKLSEKRKYSRAKAT